MDVRYISSDELMHYGIKGMKWGVRRYQDESGSLTEAGKSHYNKSYSNFANSLKKRETKAQKLRIKAEKMQFKSDKRFEKAYRTGSEERSNKLMRKGYKYKRLASKYNYKASKIVKRGQKYCTKKVESYKDIPVSTFNKEDLDYVKKYTDKIINKYA